MTTIIPKFSRHRLDRNIKLIKVKSRAQENLASLHQCVGLQTQNGRALAHLRQWRSSQYFGTARYVRNSPVLLLDFGSGHGRMFEHSTSSITARTRKPTRRGSCTKWRRPWPFCTAWVSSTLIWNRKICCWPPKIVSTVPSRWSISVVPLSRIWTTTAPPFSAARPKPLQVHWSTLPLKSTRIPEPVIPCPRHHPPALPLTGHRNALIGTRWYMVGWLLLLLLTLFLLLLFLMLRCGCQLFFDIAAECEFRTVLSLCVFYTMQILEYLRECQTKKLIQRTDFLNI